MKIKAWVSIVAKNEIILGTKSNGIVKVGVSKYKFSYRKKQTNYKDFVRTKSIINTGGKQSVKAEYNRWLKSLEEDENQHFSQSTYAHKKSDVRLGTYIEYGGDWEKWAKQNYSRSSFPNMETAIKIIRGDKEFCHLYISKITKNDCQTFFKKVYARKKLKENSLIKVKQALSSVFVSREEEINPILGIGFKDYYKHEVDRQVKKDMILRDDQLKIALNRVKETKDKRFITVVYLTLFLCLRRGEVHGLRVSDIKWDENKINIDRTVVQLKEGQIIQNWTKMVKRGLFLYLMKLEEF